MPGQRHGQFLRDDPTAVITHANEPGPAALDINLDFCRARVEAVFDQFFDDRGRPFDHLARGDLIDQFVRQNAYRHAPKCTGDQGGHARGPRACRAACD